MKSTGTEIFERNAAAALRDIRMPQLGLDDGRAIEIMRDSLAHRCVPRFHRRAWLVRQAPALLAYIEALADAGPAGWREANERVRKYASAMRDAGEIFESRRPWLLYIWHALPDMEAIGQAILDRNQAAFAMLHGSEGTEALSIDKRDDDGSGDNGSAKSGSTDTRLRPTPSVAPTQPPMRIPLTLAERKMLGLEAASGNAIKETSPRDELIGDGPAGPKGGGGLKR